MLNRLQRHTVYIIMLHEAENNEHPYNGMCFMFAQVFDSSLYLNSLFKKMLPELYNKRPNNNSWWFPCNTAGWQQRIKLLNQCIIETA